MLILTDVLFSISERFNVGPIQLQIEKGERVFFIGPSGVGKSTITALLYDYFREASWEEALEFASKGLLKLKKRIIVS